MLPTLVDDDGVLDETRGHVAPACREIRRDVGRQVDGRSSVLASERRRYRDGISRKDALESEELTCE